jgi:hypothetical protein
MEAARFSYRRDETGWQVRAAEPGLECPLQGVFRYELRIAELPGWLPVVGHCRVLGLWCVFWRLPGSANLEGAAVRADAYAAIGFDPFLAAAKLSASPVLGDVVEHRARVADDVAADEPERLWSPDAGYLLAAARCVGDADAEARQALYCSVLPDGCAGQVSPLTRFVVRNGDLVSSTPPALTTTAEGLDLLEPENDDWDSRDGSPGPPGDGRGEPSELEERLGANLLRAAGVPSEVSPPDDLRYELCSLEARLLELERRSAQRSRRLAVALAVMALALAAAVALGFISSDRRLRRLEPPRPAENASARP